MRVFFQLALIVLLSTFGGACSQPSINMRESFEQYPSIDTLEERAFVQQGLAYAIELYGEPRVPVSKVDVRYRPPQAFTNLTDAKAGLFTIFLSRRQNEYAFDGQLAHEIGHLLNAQMYDAYVEGLNNVFAEKLLRKNKMDWSRWESGFKNNGDPFYAATYFMMKEVAEIAGADSMHQILSYAQPERWDASRMYIDIEAWLRSLPSDKKIKVRAAILKHAPTVSNTMGTLSQPYNFVVPQ